MPSTTYRDARFVLPGRVETGWLRVEGGRIADLGPGAPRHLTGSQVVDLDGSYLVPGLVDVHCHGGGGAALYSGDPDDVRTVARTHLEHGTTSMLGSVGTIAPDEMVEAVRVVGDAVRDPDVPNLVGIHLEGPFLAESHRGAQTLSALRAPDTALMDRLLDAAGDVPVIMTIAPELDGALDLIRRYSGRCSFAVGHTAATYEQTIAAADAGARHVTHLFNAMPALQHRAPGPVAAALTDNRLTFELVADGRHVLPPVLALALRSAGDRAVLVTDAMAATGLGDGRYTFVDRSVDVVDGAAYLAGSDRLAGSTAFLVDCVRTLHHDAGVDLPDAVRAATAHPASVLRAADRGRLAPGARADLLVLDADLRPEQVVVAGVQVGAPSRPGGAP